MRDSGAHSVECSTAIGGTCHCDCHGSQHGVAHVAKAAISKIRTEKLSGGGYRAVMPNGLPPGGGTKDERIAAHAAKVNVKASGSPVSGQTPRTPGTQSVARGAEHKPAGDHRHTLPDVQHRALETVADHTAARAGERKTVRPATLREMGLGDSTVNALTRSGHIEQVSLMHGRSARLTDKGHAHLAAVRQDKRHADLNAKIADVEAQAAQAHREHADMADKARKSSDFGRTQTQRHLADQHARGLDAKAQQLRAERDKVAGRAGNVEDTAAKAAKTPSVQDVSPGKSPGATISREDAYRTMHGDKAGDAKFGPRSGVKSTATHRPAEPLPTGPVASADELKMVDREVEKLPAGIKTKGRQYAAAVRAGDRRAAKTAAYDLTRALRDNGNRAEASRWSTVAERVDERHQIRDTAAMIRDHPKTGEFPAFKSITPDEVRKLGLHNRTGGLDAPADVNRRLVHLRETGEVLPPSRGDAVKRIA